MKGSISTNQKCFECGGVLSYIEKAGVLQCQKHPHIIWRNNCFVRFGRKHTKRFKTVIEAERHLNYIRAQTDKGTFDQREWAKGQPLSFYSLRTKYLDHKIKKGNIGKTQIRHIKRVLAVAGKSWDHLQIKDIAEAELEDFFDDLTIGNKTKKNYLSVLHDFYKWVVKREKRRSKIEMPEFPDISYTLSWRNIVSMKDQRAILDEVKRLTWDFNPRIWLGIELLATYPKVRPGEMLNVKEGHINLNERWIVFPAPKEKTPKFIHLLPEHAEMIREIRGPKGLPDLYFFRHVNTISGVKAGVRFGQKQFRKWWNQACKNLNIEGVDLYGGTKHSTVTALGKVLTPEQIQRGVTGHVSDAFKRYMLPDVNEALEATKAVEKIRKVTDPPVIHISEALGSDK
ncbi:MAG: hypothetical protein R6U68_04320 [Desulfobacteraceae bacterium]